MFTFDPKTGTWYIIVHNGQDYDLHALHSDGSKQFICSGFLNYVEQKITILMTRSSIKLATQNLKTLLSSERR